MRAREPATFILTRSQQSNNHDGLPSYSFRSNEGYYGGRFSRCCSAASAGTLLRHIRCESTYAGRTYRRTTLARRLRRIAREHLQLADRRCPDRLGRPPHLPTASSPARNPRLGDPVAALRIAAQNETLFRTVP